MSRKYTGNLTNSGDHCWLDLIVKGYLKKNGHNVYKTMEGRVNKGKWKEMQVGDELLLKEVGGEKWVMCRVMARHEKPNFRELSQKYGQFLAPHMKGQVELIEKAYQEIVDQIRENSPDLKIDEIIVENGVVAIEIKVLEYGGFGF
jgi:ASC-1-like (ASCH) protein